MLHPNYTFIPITWKQHSYHNYVEDKIIRKFYQIKKAEETILLP